MTDLNELTAEFTQRLTDAEKRISAVMKVSMAQFSSDCVNLCMVSIHL